MTGRMLREEMAAAIAAMTEAQAALLVRVDRTDIVMGMIGFALVRVERGIYVPDPDSGGPAFITPILVHDAFSPESDAPDSAVRVGDIVDLIAWHPLRPQHWALRVGSAEWLGAIPPQYLEPDPVHIRRSVLGWFQSGCTGLVPLSRSPADIYRTLTWCRSGLEAEDDQHAADLRTILERPWPAPKVTIARPKRIANAA